MTIPQIISFINTGIQYQYISYDHKKALIDYEFNRTGMAGIEQILTPEKPDCFYMPDYLKQKYAIARVGKLRTVNYNRSGQPWCFKIGAKYSKSYYARDFGLTVKPILNPKNTSYKKLIDQGVAISTHTIAAHKNKKYKLPKQLEIGQWVYTKIGSVVQITHHDMPDLTYENIKRLATLAEINLAKKGVDHKIVFEQVKQPMYI